MTDFNLLNSALNEIYFTLLEGADGSGTGKVNEKWRVTSQTKFDDYIDYLNSQSENDNDLEKIDILKKGPAISDDNIGVYVYTQSGDESVIADFVDGIVYATVFVDMRVRKEQTPYLWKYQDAMMNFLMSFTFGIATIGVSAKTYSIDNQDSGNYATFRVDFILQPLNDAN